MSSLTQFAAILGFAFVAAWIGFGFGYAILCLGGAVLFAGAVAVVTGGVDLGEMQDRVSRATGGGRRS